ncbi:hypothetical protein FO440_06260 [Mucilaginibacter corticis]|uniref:Uncharacterized protein n=1 Tax=Mucilaginibacter corticis TaxID=2597670 RepID=A0A556MVF4_9SPHI|nr:hypothetical protein [Mucilaginibacter corticis]TSJ43788.1 hypothetical protein FO440_06260 [Mucilaginibacter corticis]
MVLHSSTFSILAISCFAIYLLFIIWVIKMGKTTALGFWGTLVVAIFGSPLLALIVVLILKSRQTRQV